MKGIRRLLVLMAVTFMAPWPAPSSPAAEQCALDEAVKLYPAPRQHGSYSLYYDISVKSPGLINIGLEINSIMPDTKDTGKFLSISLRRRDNEIELRNVGFGRDGGTFSYGIDAYELERAKGEYRIVISNWSLQQNVAARLVVLYPGQEEAGMEEGKILLIPGCRI